MMERLLKVLIVPDIFLQGNKNGISNNGTVTSNANFTDYGVVDSFIGTRTYTYSILNNGSSDLILV